MASPSTSALPPIQENTTHINSPLSILFDCLLGIGSAGILAYLYVRFRIRKNNSRERDQLPEYSGDEPLPQYIEPIELESQEPSPQRPNSH
ncbi:hypothetical protein BCR33DRAFT_721813 [Rhizoclosmatium globosum]|uniref:Uncharacterized protein n=1 Tax=Rhizoclosmatium globosum TaxID=329046 RepID=A0A1Y2BQ61_9FUNG|nr:hypothetical protein BCR33DRAFT_721813 [Rhizoclosmatium globosum]|eukprot:ORY36894.1 hypothetical protein BCR33DRAFT_721813 [Rhizoclosmatium globosum]